MANAGPVISPADAGRIFQPFVHRLVTAAVGPCRDARVDRVRARGVKIHIGRDLHPIAPCFINQGDDAIHFAEVPLAGCFEVIDLSGNSGFAADAQELL